MKKIMTLPVLLVALTTPVLAQTTTGNTGISNAPMAGGTATSPDWNTENQYWKKNFPTRPYFNSGSNYTLYEPAYQFGYDSYNQYQGKRYEELDQELMRTRWEQARRDSSMDWKTAEPAVRDAYDRMYMNRNGTPK